MAKDKAANAKAVERRGVAAWQSALERFDRLFETAGHKAIFAEPVSAEGRTVIGAVEVMIGVGGGGGGSFPTGEKPATDAQAGEGEDAAANNDNFGGGGGGGAFSRPVAVIVIDEDGVRVEPVVDATKVALAAITAFGSMIFMMARMWSAANSKRG
jgi:uncharacterized spore protein YtfJ